MGSKLSFAQRQLDLFKTSWMTNANVRRTPLDFHTHVGVGLQRPLQLLQRARDCVGSWLVKNDECKYGYSTQIDADPLSLSIIYIYTSNDN